MLYVEGQTLALKVSRRSLLLLPPVGLLAHLLSGNANSAAIGTSRIDSSPEGPFERTAFIDLNLGFVLLAALERKPACRCRLALRVQSSSAVFLRLTQDRFDAELRSLLRQDLLTPGGAYLCDRCERTYALSPRGRTFLASRVEEWQLSRLANSALNT